jgi:hypothetical protein
VRLTFEDGTVVVLLPVMEHVVGGRDVVGLMSAGLCGDGMPIMKGMLLDDALLIFLGGGDDAGGADVVVLEAFEPARERRVKGAGIADAEPIELVREMLLFERPRSPERVGRWSSVLGGSFESCVCSGELRKASAITSLRGGVRNPMAFSCAGDVSYNPYCGRGGRSGVDFPLALSGLEAERWRYITAFLLEEGGVRQG